MGHSTHCFNVFEYLIFNNTPDLSCQGFHRLPGLGPQPQYWLPGDDPIHTFPDYNTVLDIAISKPSSAEQRIYYFDVEMLPTGVGHSQLEWAESIIKLSAIAAWFKSERPNILTGYYGLMPERQYWPDNRGDEWLARNAYFKPLAEYVDFIAPSLYTFYEDQAGWVDYAIAHINASKQYNKPIYPFIWPQYHNSTPFQGQLISGDYWRLQLETLHEHADGIIIWGGWQYDWASSISTTDPCNWWYQTLDFMRSKGL